MALLAAKMVHLLGNYDQTVVGMVGEILSEELLGVELTPNQNPCIDGYLDGQSVQIKTWSHRRIMTYDGGTKTRIDAGEHPQRLIVFVEYCEQSEWALIYDGPANAVGVVNNDRRTVTLSDLRPQEFTNLIERYPAP